MKDAYRNVAGMYDRLFENMNKGLRMAGLRMFRPSKGMNILDVGCGTGTHLEIYQRYECNLYGIDLSPSMLEMAQARLGEAAQLELGDATNMPYEDNKFDLIISMLSLHEMMLHTRSSVITEMKRVLKIDGRILLIDFHPGPYQPIQGWISKAIIFFSELAAGREHFRNYRQFIATKGLSILMAQNSLEIEKQRILAGGTFEIILVKKGGSRFERRIRMSISQTPYLVETDWLEDHLDDPNIRILECTTFLKASEDGYHMESGLEEWKKGHIPGSVFADLSTDLSDQDSSVQFMIPSADNFAQAMSQLGVQDDVFVVLYDSFINIWAARLWWMMRSFGFENSAILNGGWKKWKREKRPISTDAGEFRKGEFTAHTKREMISTKEDVLKAIDDPNTTLIDALTRQEYAGELAVYGRAGHIPTSVNVPAIELVDRRTRSYLPVEKLEEIFAPILKENPSEIITYCGGGAAGSSVAFALKLLGVENVSVYDGALIEWASDPELPMTT